MLNTAPLILSGLALLIAGATMLDFETFVLFVTLFAVAGGMILSNGNGSEKRASRATRHRSHEL